MIVATVTEQDSTIFVAPVRTASVVQKLVFNSPTTVLASSITSTTQFGQVTGLIEDSFTAEE